MRVRVLVAGTYNGPEHHDPVRAQPGDVIEAAGDWYAAELIEKGLVTAAPATAPHGGSTADAALPAGRAQDAGSGPSENQAAAGPTQRKPAEPRSKKISEIRKLSDLKE